MKMQQDSSIFSKRKTGCNKNQFGSVRKINGKVYIDFMYLEERVRESSNLPWNKNNEKEVRRLLNKIEEAILSGTFRFAEVFPLSKKKDFYTEKESRLYGVKKIPDTVLIGDYIWYWYGLLRDSGRVKGRTLLGYKSQLRSYIHPFFEKITFAELNTVLFDKFISWAKKQKLRNKSISNTTMNKIFIPLRMICKEASIEYGWGSNYNPFYGFKKLPENDPYENLLPLSIQEQQLIVENLDNHWKPYFEIAFRLGLRQGEQIALRPGDFDWNKGLLHIRRAITRDEKGEKAVGDTKNRYSRRTIKLIPTMLDAISKQKEIYDGFNGQYFFCSQTGDLIDVSHLMKCVWRPALEKAKIKYRDMRQTRHSFATNALSCGENPLWISKILGHRNTDMVIRVYSKYIENINGFADGKKLDEIYNEI